MKIRLLLSYQGTHFYGWQKQKKQRTVQGDMEKALSNLFQKSLSLVGSGRTDAGVHALGQNAHFELSENSLKKINLIKALNHLSPEDVSVLGAWKVPPDFHARFSARRKSYLFLILNSPQAPALFRDFVWWLPQNLSLQKLQKMSQVFLGKQDFKSFQSSGSEVQNTTKHIYRSQWTKVSPSLYSYEITGSGFLKQMVRNIVGSQIALLKHKNPEKALKNILQSRNRRKAFPAAPGKGLFLKKVFYPTALDRNSFSL